MENVHYKPCVMERLMGIDSCATQPPIKKCRVFSDNYLQKMSSLEMRRKEGNENRLSLMETDGPVFDDSASVSTCSSVEQSFSIGFSQCFDISESSNSFNSKGNEKGFTHECELSCVPYISESSGHSSSSLRANICISPAENDTLKQNFMKGQHDSVSLIQSLQDFMANKTRKSLRDDKEGITSNVNSMQSFKIRRRIYMDPEKEVAAHTRHRMVKMNLSNSEFEDLNANPLLFQSNISHQRTQRNTPSSDSNDPCLKATQALKDSRRTSKVNYSTILESFKDNNQELHHSLSTKTIRQMTCCGIALSVSTSVCPTGLADNVDQISSGVISGSEKYQDSMQALPKIVIDTFLSPEPPSPSSSEEACQNSPVSVLKSSTNAGEASDSDYFKHVSVELQEGFSECSGAAFSNIEDNQKYLWAVMCNVEEESSEISDSLKKELVKYSSWLNLGEEIHTIGNELESLLMDELIEDFFYS